MTVQAAGVCCHKTNSVVDAVRWGESLPGPGKCIYVLIMPRHKYPGHDHNRNQCIICNITKYTCIPALDIYFKKLCLGMIIRRNNVFFGYIILGQVRLSPTVTKSTINCVFGPSKVLAEQT